MTNNQRNTLLINVSESARNNAFLAILNFIVQQPVFDVYRAAYAERVVALATCKQQQAQQQ